MAVQTQIGIGYKRAAVLHDGRLCKRTLDLRTRDGERKLSFEKKSVGRKRRYVYVPGRSDIGIGID